MINVGIIGIGFMGVTHYKAFQEVSGARAAAISTRDAQKLSGDWRSIQGNFGESGGVQDVSEISRYEDWRELLTDDSIDLVDICLPTHLHRDVTIAALQAGKHVLVEKPLALTLEDCDAMIAAAKSANRLLMVGQVLRFFAAFAELREIVHSQQYGALLGAHFKRIISAPSWSNDDHFSDVSKSGGPAIDLHIHDTDFVHYLAGVPHRVHATGVLAPGGGVTYLQSQYLYDDQKFSISSQSGAIAAPGLAFENGYDVYLENATLQFNNLFTGEDIWIYTNGEKQTLRPDRPDGFVAQLQHATECVAQNRESDLISAASARRALQVCLAEQQSVLSGETISIND